MPKVDHSKNIIEIKNVSFNYNGDEVLHDVSFDVHQGDYLGIIGPNGAGKTTLLKIILGVLRPTHGVVKIFGQDVRDFKERSKISYVPQKVTNFDANFPVTVEDVVLMGRYAHRGLLRQITKEDKTMVKTALEQVDMLDYKNRLIGDLSGGQQQRVFIARALASQPKIIFLDEPTTGIDEKTQGEIYALLRKLNQQLNLTLVLISHDIDVIMAEVMHVICVDKTLTCHTTPEEFLKAESDHHHHHLHHGATHHLNNNHTV